MTRPGERGTTCPLAVSVSPGSRSRFRNNGTTSSSVGASSPSAPRSSEATVQRIERGVKVRSANLIRVAAALTTIELYSEPKPVQVAEQVDLPLALFSPSLTAVGWDLAS